MAGNEGDFPLVAGSKGRRGGGFYYLVVGSNGRQQTRRGKPLLADSNRKLDPRRLKGQMVGGWLARRGNPLVLSQGRAQADRSIVGSKGARWQADKKGDFLFLSVRTENGNNGEHSCGQSRSYAESVLNGESTYHN